MRAVDTDTVRISTEASGRAENAMNMNPHNPVTDLTNAHAVGDENDVKSDI